MSRPQKSIPQPKKVAPPSVPDIYRYSTGPASPSATSNDDGGFKRHLMEPLSPSCLTVGYQRGSRIDPITHKAAVYYHQQYGLQEDQGIDLTQSPGRDSPGSSSGSAGSGSRHSTVSLDSGRSSSYLTGSVDRMNQQSDHDVIANWLMMLNSDDYLPYAGNFSSAGYDLGTIARMTPEDLTAIGITNPHHREVIKAHIDELQVNDSLPHYVPVNLTNRKLFLLWSPSKDSLLTFNWKASTEKFISRPKVFVGASKLNRLSATLGKRFKMSSEEELGDV